MSSASESKPEIYKDEADLPDGWFLHRFGLGDPLLIPILGNFVLGRNHLKSRNISKVHARLSLLDNQVVLIQDLGSRNGTYVNTKKVSTNGIVLRDSDCISLGSPLPKTENDYGFILRHKPDSVSQDVEAVPDMTNKEMHIERACRQKTPERESDETEVRYLNSTNRDDWRNKGNLEVPQVAENNRSSNDNYDSSGDGMINLKCKETNQELLNKHPVSSEIDINSASRNATDSDVIVILSSESSDSDRTIIFKPHPKRKIKSVPKRRNISETKSDSVCLKSDEICDSTSSFTKDYKQSLPSDEELPFSEFICNNETKDRGSKKSPMIYDKSRQPYDRSLSSHKHHSHGQKVLTEPVSKKSCLNEISAETLPQCCRGRTRSISKVSRPRTIALTGTIARGRPRSRPRVNSKAAKRRRLLLSSLPGTCPQGSTKTTKVLSGSSFKVHAELRLKWQLSPH